MIRRIGAGPYSVRAEQPSPEWFPDFVTPANFVDYWNDIDGKYRTILAEHWLATGFDSMELRWLAGVSEREAGQVTTEQLISVLSSLGVWIESPADFLARCGRAIARVQVDLDATGFGEFHMQAANASAADDGLPAVYAALPDGRFWSSGSSMTQDMADDALVFAAAESVTDTLIECERVSWPICVLHGGPPMVLKEVANSSAPAWWCSSGEHQAAGLGDLSPTVVTH